MLSERKEVYQENCIEHKILNNWYLIHYQQKKLSYSISPHISTCLYKIFFTTYMSEFQFKRKREVQCSNCKGTLFETNDQGVESCVNCSLTLDQTKFDNNVQFGQQKELQGKNINRQQKFNQLSSQKRLRRAANKIQDLVQKLEIPATYDRAIEAANRLLRYADNCGFFKKGKKIQLYAAAALYITLRFQKAPYLLIDFSDKMGIKMFPLARCFLKMSKKFGFQQQLPLIDPSLFIHRYCKMMNLGDKTEAVTMSAIRLIKRMKRDWMCQGRRPSSLCGAAILIATKIHGVSNQHCSTTQICKTVFVCDQTIRRRLDQFKQTKISKLTIEQFEREDDLLGVESQMDPPAFRKARLRSEQEQQIMKEVAIVGKKKNDDYEDDFEQQIPEQIIQRYSDEIAKKYEMASDRIEAIQEALDVEEDDFESNNTGGKGQLADSDSDNSEIDEKNIFLNAQQQQQRRKKWEQFNKLWIDKQNAKQLRGQLSQVKKKQKQIKNEEKADNPFDALMKDPVMQSKVNKEELKKLFASQPKQPKKQEQVHSVSLTKIFDPFRFNV